MTYLKAKNLAHFIGNQEEVENIRLAATAMQDGATLLFYGPSGVGKSTYAYILARDLLHEFNVPANYVPSHILNVSHPDLFVLDADDQENGIIGVDSVREMLEFTRLKSGQSKYKVVIIDKADQLNRNSANALLKVLEEPPHNTFIIVIADVLGRMLPTLRSRCIKFRFSSLSKEQFIEIMGSEYADLYEITKGDVSFAKALQDKDGMVIYRDIIESFRSKNQDFAKIVSIGDRVAKCDVAWQIAQCAIKDYIFGAIRKNTDPEKLEKQLEYYQQAQELLQQTTSLHLDRRAAIANILR